MGELNERDGSCPEFSEESVERLVEHTKKTAGKK